MKCQAEVSYNLIYVRAYM